MEREKENLVIYSNMREIGEVIKQNLGIFFIHTRRSLKLIIKIIGKKEVFTETIISLTQRLIGKGSHTQQSVLRIRRN